MARVLMIGHVERFNPAFIALQSLLPAHELFACELQRLSVAPGRDQSVDIILDLMIHDLDLVLALTGARRARRMRRPGTAFAAQYIDHATALLWFPHGVSATLTASAVSHERMRIGRFYARDCQFVVDFANRQLMRAPLRQIALYRAMTASIIRPIRWNRFSSRIKSRWRWSRNIFCRRSAPARRRPPMRTPRWRH